jgi:hypothetical protein
MSDIESQIAESFERVYPTPDVVADWHDVLRRSALPVRSGERHGWQVLPRHWGSRRRLLLASSALAVAAAVALTLASPWRGGPTILDRAAAAIAAPGTDQILYASVRIRTSLPCVSAPPGWKKNGWSDLSKLKHLRRCPDNSRAAVWLDSAPPHRFRAVFVDGDGRLESGGTVGGPNGLSYQPGGVLDPVGYAYPITLSDLDPVGFIRAALASGRARVDGTATIRGRNVVRIRVTAHRYGRDVTDALYFVDAATDRPVRIVFPAATRDVRGLPMINLPFLADGTTSWGGNLSPIVIDFAQYLYLAPTTANRKLANIRAQHPHAKIL